MSLSDQLVLLGVIGAAHGVKGEVRIKAFTADPLAIAEYGPLVDEAGRLHVAGRDDDMIVSGGENVFPQEVEDCLVAHEHVGEVAAIGVEDDDYGQRLRAFVVRTGDVSQDELRDHVKAHLARFKVPRDIVFLDELPRNATGKVLKRELAESSDGHQG